MLPCSRSKACLSGHADTYCTSYVSQGTKHAKRATRIQTEPEQLVAQVSTTPEVIGVTVIVLDVFVLMINAVIAVLVGGGGSVVVVVVVVVVVNVAVSVVVIIAIGDGTISINCLRSLSLQSSSCFS